MDLLWRFVRPYRRLLLATLIPLLLDVTCALAVPVLAAQIMNLDASHATDRDVIGTGILMLGAAVVSGIGAVWGVWCCSRLVAQVGRDLREAIYAKSLEASEEGFRSLGPASLATRTTSDVNAIQTALMETLQTVVPVPLCCAISLAFAFSIDAEAAWVLVGVVGIVLAVGLAAVRASSPMFARLQGQLDAMGRLLLQMVRGVRVIRAFNRQGDEARRLDRRFREYAETAIGANLLFARLDGLSFFASNAFVTVVYWISGAQLTMGTLGIGDITAITEYGFIVMMYVMMGVVGLLTLPRALACARRVQEVLDLEPEGAPTSASSVVANGKSSAPSTASRVPGSASGLCFDRVTFGYQDASRDVLRDVSLSCAPGTTTALIGPCGAGKSTLMALALGFAAPQRGAVLFEGADVAQWPRQLLRSSIGYVPQRAWLAAGTVRSNLLWGNPEATDEELWRALEAAQALGFVERLEGGLDAPVAPEGRNFSGGQRQRLCIARALARPRAAYLLDDCFSALDARTEASLHQALARRTAGAAVLLASQRVSTVRRADRILVLDAGRAVAFGTHEELLRDCALYGSIVATQTRREARRD